jgi:hypothetical protein
LSATAVGEGPCALTHIVLSGGWPGAWCPFFSCCFVVVVVTPAAAAVVEHDAVAEVVESGQQNQILGATCDITAYTQVGRSRVGTMDGRAC